MLQDTYDVTVQLTDQDLANGICRDAYHCPVLLATFRAAKDAGIPATGGWVNSHDAELFVNDLVDPMGYYTAELPVEIVAFIQDVDNEEADIPLPAPFTLTFTREE